MNWALPEYLSDALPGEAASIERLRREILDLLQVWGYELVIPPHIEYLESLLTGAGRDLDLKTFKLVDQLSGRTLGLRADITPQVARIDAHLLNHHGITRLCYCGSILQTLPSSMTASREPMQLGAEIYGYAGLAADLEILRLMTQVLTQAKLSGVRVDLGHVGIFQTLIAQTDWDERQTGNLFSLLQAKDAQGLASACAGYPADSPVRALSCLPALYGDASVLAEARRVLPELPAIRRALDDLEAVHAQANGLALSFDLSDCRGYQYHNGLVFAAYCEGYPVAIAQGGRYDGVGAVFGRNRPATGFSTDLRELARLGQNMEKRAAVLAPYAGEDPKLAKVIEHLREQGEIVVESLPGETPVAGPICDRILVSFDGRWTISPNPET